MKQVSLEMKVYRLNETSIKVNSRQVKLKKLTIQDLELSKRVTRPDPARPTTSWSLSEPTQPGSLISKPKTFEPDPTHHGLVD